MRFTPADPAKLDREPVPKIGTGHYLILLYSVEYGRFEYARDEQHKLIRALTYDEMIAYREDYTRLGYQTDYEYRGAR